MLPSDKKIGIIGGGQLGKMLIEAGQPWNLHYTILETAGAPAADIANKQIVGELSDAGKINELAAACDVLTYEIEHINIEALLKLEQEGKRIIPSPAILEIIQDKGLQKLFFSHHQIPTTDFQLVENPSEWADKLLKLRGERIAAKLRKGGYDGKGVELVNKSDMMNFVERIPFRGPVVLEEFVESAVELAVIVARNEQGEIRTFPTVEMQFDPVANLVEYLFSPANITSEIDEKAKRIAMETIFKLDGVGVFAVELFLDQDGNIFVNEIAPRPHNSGHHTIEACYTSQYEQLNRILLGMPLGSTDLIKPSAMINLLGFDHVSGRYEITGLDQIMAIDGVFIHLYNKAETKPKRKMGHITIMGNTPEEVKDKAALVKKHLGMRQL
jgi:5-(carboxyamino)imidazole ribonucleotide synthase